MNDIFDIRRFGAFALKWYKEKSILSMLIWVLLFILVHISFWDTGKMVRNKEELSALVDSQIMEYSAVYIACLILIILVLTLRTSWKLFNVRSRVYWLLPISKLEKLVFVILNSLIFPVVIYTFFFCAVNRVYDSNHVYWETTEISAEDVEKKYGDVVTFENGFHSKIYPKIAFTDLLITADRYSSISSMLINVGHEQATEKEKGSGIWVMFWMIFFVFTLALWIVVSPYKKSTVLAVISHVALLLVLVIGVLWETAVIKNNYDYSQGVYLIGGNFEGVYLVFHSNIYYLLPIAYLWVAWKKIKTIQIK